MAGVLISCSPAAYAFARIRFAGCNLLFAVMPDAAAALPMRIIPQYALFRRLDLINTYVPLWLGKYLAADAFFVFPMAQFMRNLPRE